MRINLFNIIVVAILATMGATTVNAQFYTSRKHDSGNDTLKVYNSWKSLFFNGPDTVAINPNIEIASPFNFKFKPTEKDSKPLRKMIEKQSVVTSIGDSVWLLNSQYIKDSLQGEYHRIFENFVPLFFNEKMAFTQFIPTEISYLPIEIEDFEGVIAGVGRYGLYNVGDYGYVAVPHFMIDFASKSINLVDRNYLLFLLERYPDMKRRYEMMQDQNEFYMINQFFWDYIERAERDPYFPKIPRECLR